MLEKINYQGWPNCWRLKNDSVELVVTADVGPRIIYFGFRNSTNELWEDKNVAGRMGDPEFHFYGGHRLWHAPESLARTYFPDNRPVAVKQMQDGMHLLPLPEEPNGIQKELFITQSTRSSHVHILHRMKNIGLWPITLAPWSLTAMAPGGIGFFPLPPRGEHPQNLRPTGRLAIWPYTDFQDPRWHFGSKYIFLKQDSTQTKPQKMGAVVTDGWAGYARESHLFLKFFSHDGSREYPDMGSSFELYTDENMLEVETLGPLTHLVPGQTVDHVEDWLLFNDASTPCRDEDIDQQIIPKVDLARKILATEVYSPPPMEGDA